MNRIVKEAPSMEEAVALALEALGCSIDEVSVEVLEEGSHGLLGFGRRNFKVAVSKNETLVEESEEDFVYYGDEEDFSGTDEVKAEEVVENFVKSMLVHFQGSFQVKTERKEERIVVEIKGADCAVLIGRGGENLEALQFLANAVANRASKEKVYVRLDIAGYRQRHENNLAQNARRMAFKVAKTGKVFEMYPMHPADRRVVHEALQNFKGVKTYSEGEGANRRVIIAPNKSE